jgi:GxxExxY protein
MSILLIFLFEEKVILEIKAAETLVTAHGLQLINYLKATDLEVGILFNFGKQPAFKRKLITYDKKIR